MTFFSVLDDHVINHVSSGILPMFGRDFEDVLRFRRNRLLQVSQIVQPTNSKITMHLSLSLCEEKKIKMSSL